MNPASHKQAGRVAWSILERATPGKRSHVLKKCRLAAAIAETLWRCQHVGPWQWRLKHLQWYLDGEARNLSASTRYDHWRAIRAVLAGMKKLHLIERLENRKNAGYVRPSGVAGALLNGRPAKLPNINPDKYTSRATAT